MSDVAIQVENLSKRYRVGQFVGYQTLRESLINVVSAPFHHFRSPAAHSGIGSGNTDSQYIWALKDVSFEVKSGEAIGIVGRNGAGKTTLLKLLCRITEPTEGHARISGRVGSLLEVGTGFHPELTGKENVYLNGAILGMKKKEIDRKFDEIVEFSGVETFINTPLKRYSYGMQVRLAFAVAAYLETEILLVDEVLAVGDFEFQKKCLGKMQDISRGGRTVLFVSHNMGSIANLCYKTVWLDAGQVALLGDTREVISKYIDSGAERGGEVSWNDIETAPGSDNVRLKAVRIRSNGNVTCDVFIDEEIVIEIDYWNLQEGAVLYTAINLRDKVNSIIFDSANWPSANLSEDPWARKRRPYGLYRSTCVIPANFLNNDHYTIDVGVADARNIWQIGSQGQGVLSFTVHESGEVTEEYVHRDGVIRPKLAWSTVYLSKAQ
jgi:lipopolysaccharide transport system ATP-binding protein